MPLFKVTGFKRLRSRDRPPCVAEPVQLVDNERAEGYPPYSYPDISRVYADAGWGGLPEGYLHYTRGPLTSSPHSPSAFAEPISPRLDSHSFSPYHDSPPSPPDGSGFSSFMSHLAELDTHPSSSCPSLSRSFDSRCIEAEKTSGPDFAQDPVPWAIGGVTEGSQGSNNRTPRSALSDEALEAIGGGPLGHDGDGYEGDDDTEDDASDYSSSSADETEVSDDASFRCAWAATIERGAEGNGPRDKSRSIESELLL